VEAQKAVGVDGAEVAGVYPAVADGRGSQFRFAPVAEHGGWASHAHLADLAGWEVVVVVEVADAYLRGRASDGPAEFRVGGGPAGCRTPMGVVSVVP
jgi:hypothetical protein